jgi:hypothetical protein
MSILNGVPVKTRLPAVAWIIALIAALYSLMPSVTDGTEQAYHASMGFLSILPGS